ncbi:ferredoxin--NADP reductase [Polyangium jinanense]|uniref:Ferredoxin--NADP reductase n=1 Tax=Polyangium jinanense TaxID=2829994 RepID=A0A9X3XA24_9BACT|nr:ferredoxin--NADP reductase [Polyangium jinanense]MDC3956464.1 ferredoxin--NADP reductase [Polyangium jinanense]MDC3985495.1 ferredoxin--NADP reductase [Polyangium jinanense]
MELDKARNGSESESQKGNDARRGFGPAALLPATVVVRLEALVRDVRTVLSDFTGARPPPYAIRAPLARHLFAVTPESSAGITPRRLRVTRVVRETKDAVSLTLTDPEGRRISFVPGQFFTVLVTLTSGEVLRRAYSISSLPDEDGAAAEVTITIKRMPDGRASNHLNERVAEGDVLDVLGPSGNFTVTPDPAARRHLVLLAGGSGITPLASITRTTLAREPGSRVSLVYGNRGEADIIFRDAFESLARAHADRFTLRHVLSDPPAGFTGRTGLLDRDNVTRELDAIAASSDLDADTTAYYVCGPEPMMVAAREALLARGVAPARIHEERFSAPARRTTPALPTTSAPVEIRLRGRTKTVSAAPGQTLLEAGLAASLPMPFSCTMGGCGVCKVKLLSGNVTSEEPNCLHEEERSQGFVLACVSRAAAPCTVEVP